MEAGLLRTFSMLLCKFAGMCDLCIVTILFVFFSGGAFRWVVAVGDRAGAGEGGGQGRVAGGRTPPCGYDAPETRPDSSANVPSLPPRWAASPPRRFRHTFFGQCHSECTTQLNDDGDDGYDNSYNNSVFRTQ